MRGILDWLMVALLVAIGAIAAGSVSAQELCDFISGGGRVPGITVAEPANFGLHGGCKHGAYWGHVNVLDKGFGPPPGHLKSTRITAYLVDGNARHICGEGEVVKDATGERFSAKFHAKVEDNAQGGVADRFGIVIEDEDGDVRYHLIMRPLTGGNIERHKEKRSTIAPGGTCEVEPPGG